MSKVQAKVIKEWDLASNYSVSVDVITYSNENNRLIAKEKRGSNVIELCLTIGAKRRMQKRVDRRINPYA